MLAGTSAGLGAGVVWAPPPHAARSAAGAAAPIAVPSAISRRRETVAFLDPLAMNVPPGRSRTIPVRLPYRTHSRAPATGAQVWTAGSLIQPPRLEGRPGFQHLLDALAG